MELDRQDSWISFGVTFPPQSLVVSDYPVDRCSSQDFKMATDFLKIFLLFEVCFLSACMCERLTSGSLGSKDDSVPRLIPISIS